MHFVKLLNLFKFGGKCLCFLKRKIMTRTCFLKALKSLKTLNVATATWESSYTADFVIAILKKNIFLFWKQYQTKHQTSLAP